MTITTVGYSDFYPVTTGGHIAGAFIMWSGVGVIGALASILSSVLVGQPSPNGAEDGPTSPANPSLEETWPPSKANWRSCASYRTSGEMEKGIEAHLKRGDGGGRWWRR